MQSPFYKKKYFALKLSFRKAEDQDGVTDPLVVLNKNLKTGFAGTNYQPDFNGALTVIMEQIDNSKSNGSGWIVKKVPTFDLKLETSVPWS